MQEDPLLEKLDWVFISISWSLSFPATTVTTLSRPISDHVPYVVKMDSHIPKASIFRFENFLVQFPGFFGTVQLHWHSNPYYANMARTISTRFKQLRVGLRKWSREISQLNRLIHNSNWVLAIIDGLEEQRPLSRIELNFRRAVKSHMQKLLEEKRVYCKQILTVWWVKFGDENSELFQAIATHSYRRNCIQMLQLPDGTTITDHALKAGALWSSFKERLGITEFDEILFDLRALIAEVDLP